MTPYREIAKAALINWNGLSEEEATRIATTESIENLEDIDKTNYFEETREDIYKHIDKFEQPVEENLYEHIDIFKQLEEIVNTETIIQKDAKDAPVEGQGRAR